MFRKIYRSMNFMSLVTLAMTTVLILSACYTTFNKRLEEEVKTEGRLLAEIAERAFVENNLVESLSTTSADKRITIISPDGDVLFDNKTSPEDMENHMSRPEVKDAFKKGEGAYRRYSATLNSTAFYYAVRLTNGCVLRISDETHNIIKMFTGIIIPIIITVISIYLLCIVFSKHITSSILRPINNMDLNSHDYSGVYEELIPFLKRISGQKEEIRHQAEKVKREELKLETISDNMSEGLIVLDKNSNIILANNSVSQIFGLAKEKIYGVSFGSILEDKEVSKNISQVFGGEKCHGSLVINDKVYQVFYSPVLENDVVKGVIILMFDISEEMKASQMRREFSANVSHELKTPLTTILGYSQIINNDIAKQEDIKNFTVKIEREATRLITLIDDIIKLSRLDEDLTDDEKTEVSLKEIVTEVIESLADKAKQRGITFVYDGADSMIYANYRQIMELVYNLCDNAVKYNKDEGTVTVTVADKVISVADTGIGIPAQHLGRIYERFYRVDKSRSRTVNGTGLGLSIVKHVAMQNDGVIEAESRVGEGSVFTVKFGRKEVE